VKRPLLESGFKFHHGAAPHRSSVSPDNAPRLSGRGLSLSGLWPRQQVSEDQSGRASLLAVLKRAAMSSSTFYLRLLLTGQSPLSDSPPASSAWPLRETRTNVGAAPCGTETGFPGGPLHMMNRTRLSLYTWVHLPLSVRAVLAPHATLPVLQSNGEYGDVFPRVAGMS